MNEEIGYESLKDEDDGARIERMDIDGAAAAVGQKLVDGKGTSEPVSPYRASHLQFKC